MASLIKKKEMKEGRGRGREEGRQAGKHCSYFQKEGLSLPGVKEHNQNHAVICCQTQKHRSRSWVFCHSCLFNCKVQAFGSFEGVSGRVQRIKFPFYFAEVKTVCLCSAEGNKMQVSQLCAQGLWHDQQNGPDTVLVKGAALISSSIRKMGLATPVTLGLAWV
jgi:hypothetical protein